jgi:hypothetical protein
VRARFQGTNPIGLTDPSAAYLSFAARFSANRSRLIAIASRNGRSASASVAQNCPGEQDRFCELTASLHLNEHIPTGLLGRYGSWPPPGLYSNKSQIHQQLEVVATLPFGKGGTVPSDRSEAHIFHEYEPQPEALHHARHDDRL